MASFKAINTHVRCVTVWDLLKSGKEREKEGKKKKERRKECDDIIDLLYKKKKNIHKDNNLYSLIYVRKKSGKSLKTNKGL